MPPAPPNPPSDGVTARPAHPAPEQGGHSLKVCTACKWPKPLSDYQRDSRIRSGLRSRCRECTRDDDRTRRTTGRQKDEGPAEAGPSYGGLTRDAIPPSPLPRVAPAQPEPHGEGGQYTPPSDTRPATPVVDSPRVEPKPSTPVEGRPNFQPRTEGGLERWLFIPDVHRPYHDQAAWRLLLYFAQEWRPHGIVILGDYVDFYAISAHDKNPSRKQNLKWELEDANAGLDELDSLGARQKIYIRGNHCQRWERYMATNAPAVFDLLNFNAALRLQERGWRVTDYKDHAWVGQLAATHDTGSAGRYAAIRSGLLFQGSLIQGHIHSSGVWHSGDAMGRLQSYASFGWLGSREASDYMHRVKAMRDWVLGFGVGYKEPDGFMHIQPVAIRDYRCVVEGRMYAVR